MAPKTDALKLALNPGLVRKLEAEVKRLSVERNACRSAAERLRGALLEIASGHPHPVERAQRALRKGDNA